MNMNIKTLINSMFESGFTFHKQLAKNSFIENSSDGGISSSIPYGINENISNQLNISTNVRMETDMELPWYGHAICITTMLFIWVVGSAGNFLVIYVVCKEKQLQTPINMFLVNLSLADFITSAFGSPFPLIASILQRWPFGEMMCILYAFGMSLGGITSITTLMVLAFERYLMIARPFRAADIRLYQSSVIILFIWVYSMALTLPPLFGWASYGPEGPYISCSVSWEKDDLATKTYICFLFVLGLVIPMITITFSYIGIVSTIKSTSQAPTCTRRATGRAELRVTAMVAVMITCFLIAWSPYAIVSLMISFGGPNERQLITPLVSVLPAIFAKSATCYNPIIYVGLNTQFQNAWMKVFGIQREDADTQTGLTASVGGGGTTSAVPPPSTLGIQNAKLCVPGENSLSQKGLSPTHSSNSFTEVHSQGAASVSKDNVQSNVGETHNNPSDVDYSVKATADIELVALTPLSNNDNELGNLCAGDQERDFNIGDGN